MFTRVPNVELEALLSAIQAGHAKPPLSEMTLDRVGAASLAPALSSLASFDAASLTTLIEALLEERRRAPVTPELIWTGPAGRAGTARSTSVVFRELLESARRDVWMAGYSIDHGERLFAPLHAAMRDHEVEARFLLHPQYERNEERAKSVEAGAQRILNRFLTRNWPFGDPTPDLYYDPRPLEPRARASMHIKAVVVDEARVLIGSANFTDRGQHRNYEAGAYLEDPAFARRLVTQLRSLIDGGHVRKHGDES